MVDAISAANSQVVGMLPSKTALINAGGWGLIGLIVVGLIGWGLYAYAIKRQFNKKITIFEVVGSYFEPVMSDVAKIVRLGSGGFQILYLKKLKCFRLSYGGRIGKNTYYFFVGKDGYWYNSMLGANILTIDKLGGLIPVVTANPTMRAQYTALEKQIESLHGEKKTFWDKYGSWVLNGVYISIIGVFTWLIFREFSNITGAMTNLVDSVTKLLDRAQAILLNSETQASGGLGQLVKA